MRFLQEPFLALPIEKICETTARDSQALESTWLVAASLISIFREALNLSSVNLLLQKLLFF